MNNKIHLPSHRKIRGYAFDPSFSSTLKYRLSNEVLYKVRWEDLAPGPVGEYVEVIDFDPVKQCFYEPVDLNNKYILAEQGLQLADDDPKFHQQQVYAVVMSVIEKFEKAWGRKLIFSRLSDINEKGVLQYKTEYVKRLRIYPHAMYQQNAFYSPQKKALLFGYFRAQGEWKANNIPGAAVFTCLSPDIVSHECTHAVLDSIHPYLNNDTNPDMLAFHEGFADIIALLHKFNFRTVVQEQLRNSRGDLQSPENMLGSLAFQFGQALPGARRSLRSYLFDEESQKAIAANPAKYHNSIESHERGAILVATVFDAFARLYKYRVADLLRIATDGTGILSNGDINLDLVNRLTEEACKIAEKLMLICIRAIDYCPPVDLYFSDYLRALLTADVEYNPDDEDGMRFALMESFRSWGIVPENLNSYSLQSLVWQNLDEYYSDEIMVKKLRSAFEFIFRPGNTYISLIIERILRENNREIIFDETRKLAAEVHKIFETKLDVGPLDGMENLLGLNFKPISYTLVSEDSGKKTNFTIKAAQRNKFQVHRCRPFIRNKANNGESSKQLIITFLQKVSVNLKDSPYQGYFANDTYDFRGGATLILDLATYDIKYAIVKSISSSDRLQRQLEYEITNKSAKVDSALLLQGNEPFAMAHSH